jgi:hypothetical protein
VQSDAFFDMLSSITLVVTRAFRGKFIAADGAFIFLGDLASGARGLRVESRGRYGAGKHVDYGLRAGAEIEGEAAVVGGCVAGYGGVGSEWGCLRGIGWEWWQPALSRSVGAVVADSSVVAGWVVEALGLCVAHSYSICQIHSRSILHTG